MKKYRRFSTKYSNAPILFFVSAFVLGTLLLVFTFVVLNKGVSTEQHINAPADFSEVINLAQTDQLAGVATTTSTALTQEEYAQEISALLAEFIEDATNIVGSWVNDEGWETAMRVTVALNQVRVRVQELRHDLLALRVPTDAREQHFALVIVVDNLIEALTKGQIYGIEGGLLRIKEMQGAVN